MESVITIQAEDGFPLEQVPHPAAWDVRRYGRNILMFFVKGDERQPENRDDNGHSPGPVPEPAEGYDTLCS